LAAPPSRVAPFLGRGAVVRESDDRAALAGRNLAPPVVIAGRATPGPRQDFDSQQIQAASALITRYVEKITAVKCGALPLAQSAQAKGPRIFLGAEGDPREAFPELKTCDDHGFLIVAQPGERGPDLRIVGRTGVGVLYGAWFFLMHYADVRIVGPYEMGEVCPARDTLEIPQRLYLLNPGPDFLLRVWSSAAGFDAVAWLTDVAGTPRFEYHHNMFRVFDPKRFGESHLEYYPMVDGAYAVPKPGVIGKWQPTFSNPAVAERTIEYAGEVFGQRPDLESVSVSVNDGGGYSEVDIRKCAPHPGGVISVSKVYYAYVNAVARGVGQRWPGKSVAFFPYGYVAKPPDFALEDNVILFLLNEPKTSYAAWKDKVKSIGVYQWLYGWHYVIPNHWPHAMQDYLRWVRARGGKAFKGEACAAWAQDGPKMWVLSNLLWNVDADVDALLADYYEHAYGPEAAPAVARYFAQAEKIYERRRTPEEYRLALLRPGDRQFDDAAQEDFDLMSSALAEAAGLVRGEANKTRLDMTTRCFRYGEFYWRQCSALRMLAKASVKSDADAEAMVGAARRFYDIGAERDAYFKSHIEPMAQYCIYTANRSKVETRHAPAFNWPGLEAAMDAGLGAVTAFKRNSATSAQLGEYWARVGRENPSLSPFAETQRLGALRPGAGLANLFTNGSFEEPPPDPSGAKTANPDAARDWPLIHHRNVNAKVWRDVGTGRTGKASLTAKGMSGFSGVRRELALKNGARYRLSFWYRTSPETPGVRLDFVVQTSPGEYRPRHTERIPPAAEWTRVERIFTLDNPPGSGSGLRLLLALDQGGSDESQVWFDDVALELLSPEGLPPTSGPRRP